MIRITKLTDYGIVLLARIARETGPQTHNVRDLAAETRLPAPTVSKLLKALAKQGLLVSQRGVKGGYALARPATEITVAQIIRALDGPIAVTDCSAELGGRCELEKLCAVRSNWQRVNLALRDLLENLTLAEMSEPMPEGFVPLHKVNKVSDTGRVAGLSKAPPALPDVLPNAISSCAEVL